MQTDRGVSPVLGVLLMVVLTALVASVFATGVLRYDAELNESVDEFEEVATTMAANPWMGSRGDLVRPADDRTGATDVSYRINFTVEPDSDTVGNSLNSIYLEVTTGSPNMFSDTGEGKLERIAIDEDSDGSEDRDITYDVDGWQVENSGSAVKVELSGSAYTADENDSIIVVFDGVKNPPSAGEYDLRAQTSGDGNWHSGTIIIRD
ncbi:hypothetical protein BRD06_02235 [Halobacteriales archaeon QS_9_67_15]|nr:MAG: hypothetical protein BRD06_02235 [Halobacteriales archaeon QS_9_67_15]